MADIVIQNLIEIHIKPVLELDTGLTEDIPALIAAQIAMLGFADEVSLTDKQKVFVAATTLESIIPRLALIYNEQIEEHRTGPETIKLPPRSDFFRALQNAINTMKGTAGKIFGDVTYNNKVKPWPGCGLKAW